MLASVLRTWLFGVSPTDPVSVLIAAALFIGVGLVACAIPALRATRIEPVEALNAD